MGGGYILQPKTKSDKLNDTLLTAWKKWCKEQIDEMAEVLEYAKDKGIDLGGVIFDQTAAELYEDEDDKKANLADEGTGNQTGEENDDSGTGKTEGESQTDDEGTDS